MRKKNRGAIAISRNCNDKLRAAVRGAMTKAMRREGKRRPFASSKRVPCCFCGRELFPHEATLDPIRPLSPGASPGLDNHALPCQPCCPARGEMGHEKFRGRN